MMKHRLNYFKTKRTMAPETTKPSAGNEEDVEWEVRPSGMLVQKRSENSQLNIIFPNLRIRVEFGTARYQISAIPQSNFGELKKKLTVETGLQVDEQRLVFRGKVRENSEYLDRSGVKDRSKVILMEDPESKERKLMELRRNIKIQADHRLVEDVAMEVDRLAEQVCVIEKSIANGNKVAELQITTLVEMLMRQAVKLDGVLPLQEDACGIKDLQGKRVQNCVEMLDILMVSNAKVKVPLVVHNKWRTSDPVPAVTKWELFE